VKKVVIVSGCESYRTGDFLAAASLLRLDAVVATDARAPIDGTSGHLEIDLGDPALAAARIADAVPDAAAVVAVDDEGVSAAALAAEALQLPHNPPEAVTATRDKLAMRRLLASGGIAQPRFAEAGPDDVPQVAAGIGFPVVIKPVGLSASRGVFRVDTATDAEQAELRIRTILAAAQRDPGEPLLVEEYVPGVEVAIEGLLVDGDVQILAVIDKPDPLDGPFFAETMFVTPSRHPADIQDEAVALIADAARALGLRVGPIHAEVRIPPDGPAQLIEIAARSIGGLCGRSLSFGLLAEPLEVVVLKNALGISRSNTPLGRPASGVLMLPIPASGTFTGIENTAAAKAITGIDDVTITVAKGRPLQALPEGNRYLGFVFASGATPDAVEGALRRAAATLIVTMDGEEIAADPLAAGW
jgi:hypothetical protein